MNGKTIEINSKNGKFPAYLVKPEGPIKGAMIVIHEVWGLTDHVNDIADRVAAEGYIVLAPDLLSGSGIDLESLNDIRDKLFDPEKRAEVQPKIRELMAPIQAPEFALKTVDNTKECFNYLENMEEVNGRIGIMGFCFGGTYSFSLAVHEPKLKLAVPFYGHANFTVEELKNIKCPILAFYGEQDEALIKPLPELKEKMSEAGVNFTAQVYENCGHAFFNDTNKFTYNQAAATDAWEKTLRFLEANIS